MTIYFAVCLGILTLTHVLGLVFIIYTLSQMRRSSEAIEVLAYQAQEQVERLSEATSRINDFAGNVRSGWIKVMTVGIGATVDFLSRMRQRDKK
ncbi:MAG: hypothetical protein ABIJ96_04505 [Elusimicrobiota bacterium]